jgi:hypothetical protein
MKIKRHRPAATTQDLLVTVARSIGSTLGAVAAKVSAPRRKSHRRASQTRAARHNLASKSHRRASRSSKRRGQDTGFKRRNRKKSAK